MKSLSNSIPTLVSVTRGNLTRSTLVVMFAVIVLLAHGLFCRDFAQANCSVVNAEDLFSFCLPRGFVKTDMMGVEHPLGEYYRGQTRLLFVWGDTASNTYEDRRLPEMQDYAEEETNVSGKRANIRTYSVLKKGNRIYRAEMNLGDWKAGKVILYMELESDKSLDLTVAREVFRSVRLGKST